MMDEKQQMVEQNDALSIKLILAIGLVVLFNMLIRPFDENEVLPKIALFFMTLSFLFFFYNKTYRYSNWRNLFWISFILFLVSSGTFFFFNSLAKVYHN